MLAPTRWMMVQHLEWLANFQMDYLRLEIGWGTPDKGPHNGKTFALDELEDAADEAMRANLTGHNVYVGVTLKHPHTPSIGRTRNEHAVMATCLAFDFDRDSIAGATRLGQIARPQRLVITGRQPELRLQLWLRLQRTDDFQHWQELSRRCAVLAGADVGALGVGRLMRLAGSVSYPSPAKQARGYIAEATELIRCTYDAFDMAFVDARLPSVSAPDTCTSRDANTPPVNVRNVANVHDLLKALPIDFAEQHGPWLRVGFALHHFDPGDVGLALWQTFSRRSPVKAAATDFPRLWVRFGRTQGNSRVTLGTLIYHARRAGWREPQAWDYETGLPR